MGKGFGKNCIMGPHDNLESVRHCIKGQVYETPPANVDELQERITNEFAALRRTKMARRAMRAMRTRAISTTSAPHNKPSSPIL